MKKILSFMLCGVLMIVTVVAKLPVSADSVGYDLTQDVDNLTHQAGSVQPAITAEGGGVKIGPVADNSWCFTRLNNDVQLDFSDYRYFHYDITAQSSYFIKIILDGNEYLIISPTTNHQTGVLDLSTVLPATCFDGATHPFNLQIALTESSNNNDNHIRINVFTISRDSVPPAPAAPDGYSLTQDVDNLIHQAGSVQPAITTEGGGVKIGPVADNSWCFTRLNNDVQLDFSKHRYFGYEITAQSSYFIKIILDGTEYLIISPTEKDQLGVLDLSTVLPATYFDGTTHSFNLQIALTESSNNNENYIRINTLRINDDSQPPESKEDVDGTIKAIYVDYADEHVGLEFNADNHATLTVPTTTDAVGIFVVKQVKKANCLVSGKKEGEDFANQYFARSLTGNTTSLSVTVGSGSGKKTYTMDIVKKDESITPYIESASIQVAAETIAVDFDKTRKAVINLGENVSAAELFVSAADDSSKIIIKKFGKEVSTKLAFYKGKNTYEIDVDGVIHTLQINVGTENPDSVNGKLGLTFVSKGTYSNKGDPLCLEGMNDLAAAVHAAGVPVTWIIQSATVMANAENLTKWHNEYGDEIALLEPADVREAEREIQRIQEVCPWATIRMIALPNQPVFSEADWKKLKDLGITSTWGNCYMQTYTDGISAEGAPWGMYNADRQIPKIPAEDINGITRVEWSSRDLNLSYRTGWPEYFSFVAMDVYRAELCDFEDITFWKNMVEEYQNNTQYNKVVPIILEQEYQQIDEYKNASADLQRFRLSMLKMLEEFCKYMAKENCDTVTASDLVDMYNTENNHTTPATYAMFHNISQKTPRIAYRDIIKYTEYPADKIIDGKPVAVDAAEALQYPDVFVYYDKNSMMFFDRNNPQPQRIYDYTQVTPENVNTLHSLPRSEKYAQVEVDKTHIANGYAFKLTVNATSNTPYGTAIWGDYSEYDIHSESGVNIKKIGTDLIFVEFEATAGKTEYIVTAKEKGTASQNTEPPQTGVGINLMPCITLALAVGTGVIGTVLYTRKRKHGK